MIRRHPTRIVTKIAGITFEGRQELLAKVAGLGIQYLELVRDGGNPSDPQAVAVEAPIYDQNGNLIESIRLGYLPNSDRICGDCRKQVDGATFKRSSALKCPVCGGGNWLRDGLAGKINAAMAEGVKYECTVLEYTGGGIDDRTNKYRSRGCNILIERADEDVALAA